MISGGHEVGSVAVDAGKQHAGRQREALAGGPGQATHWHGRLRDAAHLSVCAAPAASGATAALLAPAPLLES